MKIAVFGAGGVGGYFGARLAAAGHDIHFIARGEHLEAIRRRGLRVQSIKGDLVLFPRADPVHDFLYASLPSQELRARSALEQEKLTSPKHPRSR